MIKKLINYFIVSINRDKSIECKCKVSPQNSYFKKDKSTVQKQLIQLDK